ncbi:MAG: hypothetical protein ACTHZ1_06060 [Sphingobacterium sp.]
MRDLPTNRNNVYKYFSYPFPPNLHYHDSIDLEDQLQYVSTDAVANLLVEKVQCNWINTFQNIPVIDGYNAVKGILNTSF